MIAIKPLTITDSNLTSASTTETDETEWDSGTTYAADDLVMVTTPNIHTIYISVQGSNTNHNPVTDDGTWWTSQGATNRWELFDGGLTTQTTDSSNLVYVITPGEVVNAVAVLNAAATSAQVQVIDPTEGTVYDSTVSLTDEAAFTDWYGYFYDGISAKRDAVFIDLPAYSTAAITVTFTTDSGTASVGELVLGLQQPLGTTLVGTVVGTKNRSIKVEDSFGNYVITSKPKSKRANYQIKVLTNSISAIQNFLTDNLDNPIVWIGEESQGATIVYGYIKDHNLIYSEPEGSYSDFSLQIEGLS